MVKTIESYKEFNELITSSDVVIIHFWATGSGPCQTMSLSSRSLESDYPGTKFYKVDVDKHPDIVAKLGISSLPIFVAHKNGTKVGDYVGDNPQGLVTQLETVAGAR
ncbi:hypothetical protein I350_00599 [Cryptococcus amylolentus CBS 6273]|uniref:Thioredoxin domain-containing protein n=1 Tax=Cryptococcus amylolentus CBS 6273 TaxID=1296118 RepID=A0A1E3KFM1_9TREE|nr:hypothetical protein I350_00599 [Cryptococcus amylolentus CBS 6273]